MDDFLPLAFQVSGLVLILAITVQVIALSIASIRRTNFARSQHQRSLELLDHKVEIARRHRVTHEKESLSWQGFRKFSVFQKVIEGGDICSFYLKPHDSRPLAAFKPGQFLTFKLDIPGDQQPTTRCYSLSSVAHESHYRISIKRVLAPKDHDDIPPGKSSNFFHDFVKENDLLDVKAPSGNFFLDVTKTTPVVLVGGGIGLTPVLSMLEAVVAHGFQRDVWLFYGVRNDDEHIMKDYLDELDKAHHRLNLKICYSSPKKDSRINENYHYAERVTVDLFKRVLVTNNFEYYICGPPPMMESLVSDLKDWGVPAEDIHFEAFGPASIKKTAVPSLQSDGIKVTFQKSNKTLNWTSEAGSLLEFAETNGVVIDAGCRAGNCGTCLTAVRSGEIDYLNEPGERPDPGSCLVCVGVPKSELVLDA